MGVDQFNIAAFQSPEGSLLIKRSMQDWRKQ